MKKVRIYGTLGPACADEATLERMLREGMDGVRLNLSHTGLDDSRQLIDAFHSAARNCPGSPELLIDMQGPELRIGALEHPLVLNRGELIEFGALPLPKEAAEALNNALVGQEILLDDGKLLLAFEGKRGFRVLRGGHLTGRKSVALPGITIDLPALTENDKENIRKASEYGVTGLMQPFVRSREDLLEVRSALDAAGCAHVRLFAKIENRAGVEALDELIPYCDEIVIARGDLGSTMDLWELPAVQKHIAARCRKAGRDFMVVTQMLDSMIHRPVPTRAEVCDIFNAVLDGAASVMVTGETAAGEYPAEAIRFLANTAREAEKALGFDAAPEEQA